MTTRLEPGFGGSRLDNPIPRPTILRVKPGAGNRRLATLV
jgi:hypothetical protein